MANKAPAIKSKVINYEYVDGVKIAVIGSDTIAIRQALYQKAYDSKLIPSNPAAKEISYSDYCNLADVEGVNFKVKPGDFSKRAVHQNIKDCIFDISGVRVRDLNDGALAIIGKSINVKYKGATFNNISGYQISPEGIDRIIYNGKEGSFIDRLVIEGFTFDGGGMPFHADGNIRSAGVFDGVMKGFKFSGNNVKNIPGAKNCVYIGSGVESEISGNTFNRINWLNDEDNGLIYIKGTAKVFGNKSNDFQGYLMRNWIYDITGGNLTEFYNNLSYDGYHYAMLELQLPEVIKKLGAVSANAKVYSNSAISMNKSNQWAGMILNLYETYGQVDYYNNLGADLAGWRDNKVTRDAAFIQYQNMIYKMNNDAITKLIISGQNIYKNTKEEIVNSDFSSKFTGIGAKL